MRRLLCACAFLAAIGWADYPKDPLAAALTAAGANRPQIQKVLEHYQADPQKLDAAKYLIQHMTGKAYKVVTLVDKDGRDVGYDCLKYPNLDAAIAAQDELERTHGALTERISPTYDLQSLRAEFLIEHIDRAFEAWRTFPWAKSVTYETFRTYVLPYRGGKEPAEAWRGELMARYAGLAAKMKDPTDLREAAGLINADLGQWVGFWDLYYLHPTEQGFSEMKKSQKGRCGDLSNLATFALRANGIPCAIDYTPFWADTGNNHAWPVVLDANGVGHESVGKAAKIYRKVFANQPGNLLYDQRKGETLPPWLDRPDYVDVTSQYLPTTDVAVSLSKSAPHAYLCVFNDGEWRPIQWGKVTRGRVVFKGMGRNILYLPVAYGTKGIQPAGYPFTLGADGVSHAIAGGKSLMEVTLTHTARDRAVSEGKGYELFHWADGWKSLGKATAGKAVSISKAPVNALLWLVEEGSHHEERPFTYVDGKQVWW